MKKLFYLFILTLSISTSVNSQITLEKKLPNNIPVKKTIQKVTFSTHGDKYFTPPILSNSTTNSDTIQVFNSDWTLFKTIVIPFGYQPVTKDGGYPLSFYSTLLSDNLFNSDGLIEFIGCKYSSSSEYYDCKVFDENGGVVFSFPDTIYPYVRVLKMNNSFKLQLGFDIIYSVPGTLPCDPCSGINGLEELNGGGISELRVNPNPFNNSLEINYEFLTRQDNPRLILTDILGRELKSLPLSNQSDRINLNTSDLPKGTIIVSLIGSGQNVISKKVIKIE